ncbi:MAG: tRNA (adenosine(37)-N6)-dimethylallyltransferase MiaA [bacterium]|nr:tRNA (adenosine(37)-N6)-dimethylallyltransferase MiaA [bacterium]
MPRKQLIVIVGPTASGKSELAVKIAKQIGGEIISADSRQVYKGLDIGTAKITKKEMGGVKHYCLDIASPKKRLTVVDWKKCAEEAIASIYRGGKVPILVGGTMFYIKALTEGWTLPQVPPNLLLRKKLEKKSVEALFKILQKKDPKRARTIEPKNKRRLIRALEIVETLGKVPKLKATPKYEVLWLGIKRNPEELKKRIQKRLRKMLKRGLVQEVKKLRASDLSWKCLYEFGFEYKYPVFYLQGKISREDMKKMLLKESLDYVRRQMVWFKKEKKIHWVEPKDFLKISPSI